MIHCLSALIAGLAVTAYWGRVVRMAMKTRRRTGNAANFFPPERLGRLLRAIWIPAVAIWIAVPYAAAFSGHLPLLLTPAYDDLFVTSAGAAFVVLCLAASMVCWKRMGKSWRMGINPQEKTTLIVSGPYAYIRHPIYLLSTLMMLGTIIAVPSPLLLAAGIVHIVLLQWEARREEDYLRTVHGEAYEIYCLHVGRFLPISLLPFHIIPNPLHERAL